MMHLLSDAGDTFTPVNLLMLGITSVTGALLWCVARLWGEMETCKKERSAMSETVRVQGNEMSYMKATLDLLKTCDRPECPYAPKKPKP